MASICGSSLKPAVRLSARCGHPEEPPPEESVRPRHARGAQAPAGRLDWAHGSSTDG
jgi:hypothetical protein